MPYLAPQEASQMYAEIHKSFLTSREVVRELQTSHAPGAVGLRPARIHASDGTGHTRDFLRTDTGPHRNYEILSFVVISH